MSQLRRKQFVLNTVAAAGANVVKSTEMDIASIIDSGALVVAFKNKDFSAVAITSAVENQQAIVMALSGTLLTSKKYSVIRESLPLGKPTYLGDKKYSYTTPSTISVQNDTKDELITTISAKINADTSSHAFAGQVSKVTFDLAASGVTIINSSLMGAWIYQGASLATATWKAQIVKKATGAYTAGVGREIWVINQGGSGAFSTTNSDVFKIESTTISEVAGAANAIAALQELGVLEDAGYNLIAAYPGPARWMMTYTTDEVVITITQAGLISRGNGTVMLANKVTYTADGIFHRTGQPENDFDNADPDGAKTYETIIISPKYALADHGATVPVIQDDIILYADDSDGTKLDALKSALGIS